MYQIPKETKMWDNTEQKRIKGENDQCREKCWDRGRRAGRLSAL